MKRTGNLWGRVVSLENLHSAARAALRGKRDRPAPAAFMNGLESELLMLQRRLLDGSYHPGPHRVFSIKEPKPRLISAPPFVDRVVHHALIRVVEPLFERRFIHHSYACRLGRGHQRALAQFRDWSRGADALLKLDIRKYFPSIDHEILKAQVARVIKDSAVLELFFTIIDAGRSPEDVRAYMPGDDLFTPMVRRHGLPIGNLTSARTTRRALEVRQGRHRAVVRAGPRAS